MATVTSSLDGQIKHFNQFRKVLTKKPNFKLDKRTIDYLLENGMIEVSTAFELAIAEQGNLEHCSIDGMDFTDKSDAKFATTCYNENTNKKTGSISRTLIGYIKGVHNKRGWLRVQVYNNILDEFYYFLIPYAAYSGVKPTGIKIRLSAVTGQPIRFPNLNAKYNWWEYEVPSFKEMCGEVDNNCAASNYDCTGPQLWEATYKFKNGIDMYEAA